MKLLFDQNLSRRLVGLLADVQTFDADPKASLLVLP
jgi:predicted nuclease of predicted toxin-antitoxin system